MAELEREVETGFKIALINGTSFTREANKVDTLPVAKLIEILDRLGCVNQDDYDANGWQADYSQTFVWKDQTRFVLTGCMYYGGFSLSKIKEGE